MKSFLDTILHLDEQVFRIIREFGPQAYLVFFLIIFAETGLVIMPFLPGDSLLFALGMFCNPDKQALSIWILIPLLIFAAFVGDNLNYQIGRRFGKRVLAAENPRFFKKEYIQKTQIFFEKHGGMTLVLARWVPIVRTFAPFVAGMGEMPFKTFLRWSFTGAVIWVGVCVSAGYGFGQIPIVRDNFELAMLAVMFLSVIPVALKVRSSRKSSQNSTISASPKDDVS
ncbi:MAG: VTT domain-containing protein [Armatimonadetes bacterium]|nr:VTT domain-containing protein [Armatimonadota bacterium]